MSNLDFSDELTKAKVESFRKNCKDKVLLSVRTKNGEKLEIFKHAEYYSAYRRIVERTVKFLKELGIDNPFYVSEIFEILLWNGYLSKDKKLRYSKNDRVNNFCVLGADIMRGSSVCLNNSAMLNDILEEMGYEVYNVLVNLSVSKAKINENIEREIILNESHYRNKLLEFKENIYKILARKLVGNHVMNVFSHEGNYYGVDATNLTYANFTDFLSMSYAGTETTNIKIRPFATMVYSFFPLDGFENAMVNAFMNKDKNKLSMSDVEIFNEFAIDLFNKNLGLFDDFYLENVPDIDSVCKTLKKFGDK